MSGAHQTATRNAHDVCCAERQDVSPDERAREVEQKMTDDERFSLIISLIGAVPLIGLPRDKRIPEDVTNMSAGYTPGIPRLGIPRQWRIAEGTYRVMLGDRCSLQRQHSTHGSSEAERESSSTGRPAVKLAFRGPYSKC